MRRLFALHILLIPLLYACGAETQAETPGTTEEVSAPTAATPASKHEPQEPAQERTQITAKSVSLEEANALVRQALDHKLSVCPLDDAGRFSTLQPTSEEADPFWTEDEKKVQADSALNRHMRKMDGIPARLETRHALRVAPDEKEYMNLPADASGGGAIVWRSLNSRLDFRVDQIDLAWQIPVPYQDARGRDRTRDHDAVSFVGPRPVTFQPRAPGGTAALRKIEGGMRLDQQAARDLDLKNPKKSLELRLISRLDVPPLDEAGIHGCGRPPLNLYVEEWRLFDGDRQIARSVGYGGELL